MTDEKLLELWRSLPSDHVHIDDVIVQFGRLVEAQFTQVTPWPERMGVEVGVQVNAVAAWPHIKAEVLEYRELCGAKK